MATMDTMDRTGRIHIQPGMDVFDMDAHKIGTVVHLHERPGNGSPGATPGDQDVVEVKTGFLGLGKHYFVPKSAVRDVTEGGVFLSASRDTVKTSGWEKRPDDLEVRPANQETVQPTGASLESAASVTSWEEAMPHYRTRCFERYGTDASWERYEPRYRFAWELSRAADLTGKPWSSAAPELRQRWEVLHPDVPWEGAADTIRDVWPHGQS
jgi:hypothetical protein